MAPQLKSSSSAVDLALLMYIQDKRNGVTATFLESFIDTEAAINCAGFTSLHHLVCGLSSESPQAELQNHPELLDVVDDNGRSPLDWAATLGNADAMRTLLEHGANISLTSIEGSTVLHRGSGFRDITQMILESDQAVDSKDLCNKRNKFGNCPWHLCTKGDVLSLFIQYGCDLSLHDDRGHTALQLAMTRSSDASLQKP